MEIFKTIAEIREYLTGNRQAGKSIGFVPTMGALHQGHLSLLEKAHHENDLFGASIFVNPIQFNNKEDLEKYPRTFDDDVKKLREIQCDYLFYPEVTEMYPDPVIEKYDFDQLDKVMEGKYRPGHFNGVAVVVRKLFNIIEPDRAYFGMKDFQQLRIIQHMVDALKLIVEIVPCPTLREEDGLAMSSRNIRLTPSERKIAPVIYRVLTEVKSNIHKRSIVESERWATTQMNNFEGLEVEYFEIVDADTLIRIQKTGDAKSIMACTAVYLGKVRLIDNIIIK